MAWALPKAVTVGHLDIEIVRMTKEQSDTENALGKWDDVACIIYVLETLPPPRQAEVLLHELLHACYLNFQISPRWGEEKTCDGFALALSSVIRHNPDLFPKLGKALAKLEPTE